MADSHPSDAVMKEFMAAVNASKGKAPAKKWNYKKNLSVRLVRRVKLKRH